MLHKFRMLYIDDEQTRARYLLCRLLYATSLLRCWFLSAATEMWFCFAWIQTHL